MRRRNDMIFSPIQYGVEAGRGPKVLLCFIIGKLYIVRVEIRISLSEDNFNEE